MKGRSTLVFHGLSEEVDPASIQVHGRGFTLLSVKHKLDHGRSAAGGPEAKALESEIRAVERDIQDEQARIGILQNEEQRLLKNEGFDGGSTGLTAERVRALNDYHRERITAVREGVIGKQRRIAERTQEAQRLHLELEQLQGRKPATTSSVVVELETSAALRAAMTLRYVVRSAGWSPSYDIRVDDLSAPLALTYRAQVFQSTGEDWKNVELELSSGDPRVNGVMPQLDIWRLGPGTRPPGPLLPKRPTAYSEVSDVRGIVRDAATGEALPFVSVLLKSADGTRLNAAQTDFDGYYAMAVPPGARKIQFQYIGYAQVESELHSNNVNMELQQDQVSLEALEVVRYKTPMISKDEGSSTTTITRDQLRNAPARSTDLRGARSIASHHYVNGVAVIDGGISASYGDVTGGLINAGIPEVTTRRGSTHFSFRINIPYSIPSDGQGHAVAVKEHQLPSTYRYHCTPKLDPAAYLFAQLTGWDALDLLSGPANLYLEGTYIGETYLDTEQVSDTMDISLGQDRSVVVQRKRQQDLAQRSFTGSKRTETIGWSIEVRNTKGVPIDLAISDQMPVPLLTDITVDLVKHDATTVDAPRGMLRWRDRIPAASTTGHVFTYTVKAPKGMALVLE